MAVHEFDPPERFIAGTVGPPGGRTFFLQARHGRRLISVSCEKQQIAALADRLNDLLDAFAGGAASEQAAALHQDDRPLETPIDDEFRAAALALAWDPEDSTVLVEAHSSTAQIEAESDESSGEEASDPPVDPEVPEDDDVLRVRLTPAQARAFARRCSLVVSAGRPACPFCGGPLDPAGHICPRANGYRR